MAKKTSTKKSSTRGYATTSTPSKAKTKGTPAPLALPLHPAKNPHTKKTPRSKSASPASTLAGPKSSPPPSQFTLFPLLPTELQCQVLAHAWSDISPSLPRDLALAFRLATDRKGPRHGSIQSYHFTSSAKLPALALVSRFLLAECRSAARREVVSPTTNMGEMVLFSAGGVVTLEIEHGWVIAEKVGDCFALLSPQLRRLVKEVRVRATERQAYSLYNDERNRREMTDMVLGMQAEGLERVVVLGMKKARAQELNSQGLGGFDIRACKGERVVALEWKCE